MRTLQEKYNAVLEGNYSKAEFVRDARMSQPQFITQYNGYDAAVQILKNKGMIAEAKMQEPKYSTAKPEDTIAPDVLDTGIKFELDKKYGTLDVTDEQYAKCREMAIKNLANDALYYVKQDSIQLATPGEKMEKAKLNEETGPTGIALSQKQMDQLHDKGAVMVQVTVKDSDGSIRTVDYPLSYLGYEKDIDDTEDSDLEEGHGENPKKFKEADAFDPTKFYIKDLKSGRILNAVSVQGSKLILHYDTEADAQAQADWITRWEGDPGRFVVLSGDEAKDQVNKQIGVEEYQAPKYSKEEQQLKELFKKIITKVITE